jgi:high-affinity iron transporter
VGVTSVPGIGSVDILGIYPTVETLVPQILLLGLTVVMFVVQAKKVKKMRKAAS